MASSSSSASTSAASEQELSCPGGVALRQKMGSVRRNLFGPVDHQQLQQDFQRVLHMGVEVASKRWNFDFQREEPGPGPNMEWEELSFQEVPAFYRSRVVRPTRSGAGAKRRSSSSSEGSTVSSSSSSEEEYLEVTTRRRYRLESGKCQQAPITDFFKVKKRKRLQCKELSRQ
ncbi:cyclin-dependent kinase inhibitor 1D [Eucyclogobius newberryi]|uniref:cyclin-dependent kinase inhibitor 1D n=1 Tax=Eucyclogobius newberryi TaxID=166745 RepID=UPI003B591DD2